MVEMKGKKKRLLINLSFLTLTDSKKQSTAQKSPRNFEEPNGVVGLGILAALKNDRCGHQDLIPNNGCRTAVLVMSPKFASNPIPILRTKNAPEDISVKKLSAEKMEFCEGYTCVTSHVGKNQITRREYFEAEILGTGNSGGSAVVHDSRVRAGGEADFLSSCFLCEKMLHGLDVFMYRGENAFCSADCRLRQISIDEKKEKCRSGLRKSIKYSVSTCSVAAA